MKTLYQLNSMKNLLFGEHQNSFKTLTVNYGQTVLKSIKPLLLIYFIISSVFSYGQNVAITDDAAYTVNASAMLDVKSTTKGILIPRLTKSQRDAINNPATGLLIYQTDLTPDFYYYNGTGWSNFVSSAATAADIEIDHIAGSTYSNLQEFINFSNSASIWSGCNVTSNANGTASMTAGYGLIKSTNSDVGDNYMFNIPADASISLTDGESNMVYVDYNSGSPTISTTTSLTAVNKHTQLLIAMIYRDGNTLYIVEAGMRFADFQRKSALKQFEVYKFQRAKGIYIGETGTRNISVTAGVGYIGLNRFPTSAINTSASDLMTFWYRDGSGGWTKVLNQSQIDNQYYDDGDGTLHLLGNNRYGSHCVFMALDGTVHVLYGQGNYRWSQAEDENVPDLPKFLSDFSLCIGKVIVKKGASSFKEIISAFEIVFDYTNAKDHNELSNIQGGTADEYFHLTSAEYTGLVHDLDDLSDCKTTGTSLFLGTDAGVTEYTGVDYTNIGIGDYALKENTIGKFNISLGYNSNYFNQTGWSNTIIGFEAGMGTTYHNKTGNIFLGYQAGYSEHGSNKLYIENSNSSSPLIYGEFDNNLLSVNGNFGVGTSSFASGNNTLALANGTVPTSSISDGVLLYAVDVSSSSELRVRDEAGNITTLSPHNFSLVPKSDSMAWSYYSQNAAVNKVINVDMLKVIRTVEQISGEKLVFVEDISTGEEVDNIDIEESELVKLQKENAALEARIRKLEEQIAILMESL